MSTAHAEALLPLVPEEVKLDKSNSITWKLSIDPKDAKAGQCEIVMQTLSGKEPIRQVLVWRSNMDKVFTGMGATGADTDAKRKAEPKLRDQLVRRALTSSALSAFDVKMTELINEAWESERDAAETARLATHANSTQAQLQAARDAVDEPDPTNEMVEEGMKAVIVQACPYKALARTKRWLRRKCRKPVDMSIRVFYMHLQRINTDEIPLLPPNFNSHQSIDDDEMVDVILYAIPNSWKKMIDIQGKDPDRMTPKEFIAVLEQLEAAEAVDQKKNNISSFTSTNDSNGKKKSGRGKSIKKGHQKNRNGKKFCLHHGQNETHTTNECKVLKSMSESVQKDGDSKNKTWKRNHDGEKKDLKCYTKDASKDKPTKNSIKKRRVIADSDDEEGELRSFEYNQMADLKLSDDDNDTVSEASA